MNIKRQRKSITKYLVLLAVSVVLLGGYLLYAHNSSYWPFSRSTSQAEDQQKEAANNDDSQNLQTKDTQSSESKSENVDTRMTTNEIPVSDELAVTIDSLSQNQNGEVEYTATANSKQGTCAALFTNDLGKPVSRTSETTSGSCSASIPALEFDAIGTWKLTLRYYANDHQAIATKDVNVE